MSVRRAKTPAPPARCAWTSRGTGIVCRGVANSPTGPPPSGVCPWMVSGCRCAQPTAHGFTRKAGCDSALRELGPGDLDLDLAWQPPWWRCGLRGLFWASLRAEVLASRVVANGPSVEGLQGDSATSAAHARRITCASQCVAFRFDREMPRRSYGSSIARVAPGGGRAVHRACAPFDVRLRPVRTGLPSARTWPRSLREGPRNAPSGRRPRRSGPDRSSDRRGCLRPRRARSRERRFGRGAPRVPASL